MPIYETEPTIQIGRVVFLGRLGSWVTKLPPDVLQQERDLCTGELNSRTITVAGDVISLEPFIEHHPMANRYGASKVIEGPQINRSFLREKYRFSHDSNAEGSLLVLGFQLPFKFRHLVSSLSKHNSY